jgi:hypothetical protein
MEKNRPRPDVNVRAERAKPCGLKPSPEGALSSQHGGSAPCAVSKVVQAPRMTHDEIQQMMAGTPSLSEIIIAEREEGR